MSLYNRVWGPGAEPPPVRSQSPFPKNENVLLVLDVWRSKRQLSPIFGSPLSDSWHSFRIQKFTLTEDVHKIVALTPYTSYPRFRLAKEAR